MATQDQLEMKLKANKARMSTLKSQIASWSTRMKVKGVSAASKKILQNRINASQKLLDSLAKQSTEAQNEIYKITGQYEKLLSGTDRDAYAAVTALFKSYGLESLAGKVYEYVKNGYSADTVSILLQDTKEYKERFAGNEERKKAGLPVLSAGEYLATEASYRQIMESAGLPSGFYDQPSDFNKWIARNVSPSEIQTRVDLATQATILANPNYKKALNQMGISDSDLTAYFLDEKKALPYLQKSAATAAIGAQAIQNNLAFDQAYAEGLATSGITAEQAGQGYAQIAQEADTMGKLGSIYGSTYGQREAEEATFRGGAAAKKRSSLASKERAAFSGAAGGARAGFGQRGGAR